MSSIDTGHNAAFQDVLSIKLIMITCGVWRVLGDGREQKLYISPEILLCLHPEPTADKDSGFLAAMLIRFYSFFRKSNLVLRGANDHKTLSRQDISIRSWGLVICGRRPSNSGSVNHLYLLFSFRRIIHSAQFKPTSAMLVSSMLHRPRLPFCIQEEITSPQ